MIWLPIAMISNMAWGLGTIVDKYVISNQFKHPLVYQFWLVLLGLPVLLMIPFVDFVVPPLHIIGIIFLAELLGFIGDILYVKSIKDEDVTRINMLWGLIPIFTLIMGWFFLNQKLAPNELIAFAFLLVGAIFASLHIVKGEKMKISKVLPFMITACFLFSITVIMISYLTTQLDFYNIFIWGHFCLIPITATLFLNKNFRKNLKGSISLLNKKNTSLIFLATQLGNTGSLLNTWALSLGAAALIFSLEGFQMLFVFAITILLSFLTNIRLHEELDRKNLILKGAALIVVMTGITTLYLG